MSMICLHIKYNMNNIIRIWICIYCTAYVYMHTLLYICIHTYIERDTQHTYFPTLLYSVFPCKIWGRRVYVHTHWIYNIYIEWCVYTIIHICTVFIFLFICIRNWGYHTHSEWCGSYYWGTQYSVTNMRIFWFYSRVL